MSKLLTIYKKESFEIEARYRFPNNIPFNDARIGKFSISNVVASKNGENSEVKVKARITKNGVFEVSSPQLVEVIETPEEGKILVESLSRMITKSFFFPLKNQWKQILN
jgi:heat shock protein 4